MIIFPLIIKSSEFAAEAPLDFSKRIYRVFPIFNENLLQANQFDNSFSSLLILLSERIYITMLVKYDNVLVLVTMLIVIVG